MREMAEYFRLGAETTVLDVGGTLFNWTFIVTRPNLTILNLGPRPNVLPPDVTYVQGDATKLPFANNSFDLVFSNSVIEHVGSWENQKKMAREIQRVGKVYYVQTPNYHFPVEPHLLTPFFHWLPKRVRRKMIRNFTVKGLLTRSGQEFWDHWVESTNLLSESEMEELFPNSGRLTDNVLGLQKSFIYVSPIGKTKDGT